MVVRPTNIGEHLGIESSSPGPIPNYDKKAIFSFKAVDGPSM